MLKNLKYTPPPSHPPLPNFININFVVYSAVTEELEEKVVQKLLKQPKGLQNLLVLKVNEFIVREDLFVLLFLNKP